MNVGKKFCLRILSSNLSLLIISTMKKFHFVSGIALSIFVAFHLFNHVYSIFGAEKHIELMAFWRPFYRNIFVETLILLAVFIQIVSGLVFVRASCTIQLSGFAKLHVWSGLYLAFFLMIHVSAVLGGRLILHLDTNFYFGAAGINSFPFNLFFVPYYALAILSFFAHLASMHQKKMKYSILNLTPSMQSMAILVFGVFLTLIIFYGLTNHFNGVSIPQEYGVLVGK